jgi:hypothetical protein
MKRKGEFAVLSIGSGAQAITMAADASPDLVVLDLSLSGAAGAVAWAARAHLAVDHLDPRHGGTWRYTGSDADGNKYFFCVFRGTPSSDGIVQTVEFDGMPGQVCLETVIFTERGDTTLVTQWLGYLHAVTTVAPAVLRIQLIRSACRLLSCDGLPSSLPGGSNDRHPCHQRR